jgi:hypothetical protein
MPSLARDPVRALRSVADARDTHPATRGPLADSVSRRVTEPKVPVATGTRKRKVKCVRGLPDPGVTDTFVDGRRPAACVEAASPTVSATVAPSAAPRVHLDITSPPLY